MKKCLMIGLVMFISFVMAASMASAEDQVVKFWYHFDDPETALNPLIQKFESEKQGSTLKRNALRGMCITKNC